MLTIALQGTPAFMAVEILDGDPMFLDILQATLAAGIRVVKYVPSYGDQPNDIAHVTKCTSPVSDGSSRAR